MIQDYGLFICKLWGASKSLLLESLVIRWVTIHKVANIVEIHEHLIEGTEHRCVDWKFHPCSKLCVYIILKKYRILHAIFNNASSHMNHIIKSPWTGELFTCVMDCIISSTAFRIIILFCFTLFHFVLFHSILFHSILFLIFKYQSAVS